ncbi:hypothetical protein Isop_1753 [Isosphaera pallida ATCC 43644]|uniref:Uncharacterized protein n=1 Tax=Isosphaera pallida (strain ATCC 43644 / DSM 9630 / IS1B) TaxID=575540 RepID=E8R0Z0_ISOPI|nr:tetratricopeptide repeat protein [Isosphaera pallida]ADV62336.1 hypothetical protein Isop_1753 [Isosphaera pallida ATCC 43644]
MGRVAMSDDRGGRQIMEAVMDLGDSERYGVELPESAAFIQARALLDTGEVVEAVTVARRAAEEAERTWGPRHPRHLAARIEQANVMAYLGEYTEAIDILRAAAAITLDPSDDVQSRRERQTILLNLGWLLTRCGALSEGEELLERGVAERRTFYGAHHPGLAFGLEALAESKLAQGKLEEGLVACDQAVDILASLGHPRLPSALALTLELVAQRELQAEGSPSQAAPVEPSFVPSFLNKLTDEITQAVTEELLDRAARVALHDPVPIRRLARVLDELIPVLNESPRFGSDSPVVIRSRIALANLRALLGDHQARVEHIRIVVEAARRIGDTTLEIQALMGLALALDDLGRPDEADDFQREAVRRAAESNNPYWLALAQRNLGVRLDRLGRDEQAVKALADAVEAARASGQEELMGRVLTALGVVRQRLGQHEEARDHLDEALQRLPATHPDAITARAHRAALERGDQPCDDDTTEAFFEAVRAEVMARAPEGLIEWFDLTPGETPDDPPALEVRLSREPLGDEVEVLNLVVRHALEHAQRQGRMVYPPSSIG